MAAVVGQKLHCRRFKAFIFRSSRAMSSGMTGQTPCLTSRWDQPAQAKKSDVQQLENIGNASLPVTLPGVVRSPGSNSPASQPPEDEATPKGGVEKATAMAAKINAMLMAKGKLLTLPPLLPKKPLTIPVSTPIEEMVVTEVDINDVPINCRELLTKGKTHEEIRLYSGAVVSTKGLYMPDTEQAVGQRPLYLHVQGKTQEQVNKAVIRIKEIISEDVIRASAASGGQKVPVIPPLTLYPQPPRPVIPTPVPRLPNANSVPGQGHRPAAPHTGSFVHTKIFVGLDQALPSFNVKEKVEGPGGSYLSHIQTETGARVFLRGKGSGYIEQASKRESFEPLYVYISHPNAAGLESAKKLTESLLETVRAEQTQMTSMYSAPGATPPYAAHGFPTNSSYSSQGSWYNYPANGFAGGYAAYPGAGGYWSSANGPPSQSNLSKTPSPSSQAMIQYPVCPRKPPPFLVQDPGSSVTVEPEGSLSTPSESGSPKDQSQEGAKDEQPSSCSPGGLAHLESTLPSSSVGEEKVVERILMPPPPSPFVAPPPVTRKRQRDVVPEAPASPTTASASTGVEEVVSVKKPKANVDTSGLVPYGGDSSDEEDERTHSSKTENL